MADLFKKIIFDCRNPQGLRKLAAFRENLHLAACFDISSSEGQKVAQIIKSVEKDGDKAVSKWTAAFDNVKLSPARFRVSEKELKESHKKMDRKLLASMRAAIKNVLGYQRRIFIGRDKSFGATGIRYIPLERAGICIPGASAPLLSTVIMTAAPAIAAGVKEIAVISPPRFNGGIHPAILAACFELGIKEVYAIGGVQAVAALALGTETIRPVDIIAGPGNKWVATAKKMLSGRVKIDSIAGPSEVLVIADENGNPAFAAAEMLSQAEHNPAGAVLFTISTAFAAEVIEELRWQIEKLPRKREILACLKNYGAVAIFKNMQQCIDLANCFAPEHLQIQCGSASRKIAQKIKNAGAVFVGNHTPVAAGDYFAGPSHTLPTGGCARFSSALTSNDFIKSISIIECDKNKIKKDSGDIIRLAEAEGLQAHAQSVKIRIKN